LPDDVQEPTAPVRTPLPDDIQEQKLPDNIVDKDIQEQKLPDIQEQKLPDNIEDEMREMQAEVLDEMHEMQGDVHEMQAGMQDEMQDVRPQGEFSTAMRRPLVNKVAPFGKEKAHEWEINPPPGMSPGRGEEQERPKGEFSSAMCRMIIFSSEMCRTIIFSSEMCRMIIFKVAPFGNEDTGLEVWLPAPLQEVRLQAPLLEVQLQAMQLDELQLDEFLHLGLVHGELAMQGFKVPPLRRRRSSLSRWTRRRKGLRTSRWPWRLMAQAPSGTRSPVSPCRRAWCEQPGTRNSTSWTPGRSGTKSELTNASESPAAGLSGASGSTSTRATRGRPLCDAATSPRTSRTTGVTSFSPQPLLWRRSGSS